MNAPRCQHTLPLAAIIDQPAGERPAGQAWTCCGHCAHCGRQHGLGEGGARRHALELMELLAVKKRIDFQVADDQADPRFSTEPLFGEARGQMFGVLVARDRQGREQVLRAFSGQYNGLWQAPGWALPLFDLTAYERLNNPAEREIKGLGRRLEELEAAAPLRKYLARQRRDLSRQLMRDIHDLYELTNFRGRSARLAEVFLGSGMPTGTGDCCAPKLLNQAARNNLIPMGLAEFYWGRENRSASRQHGCFYPSCTAKCQPILGFMLCGLEEQA